MQIIKTAIVIGPGAIFELYYAFVNKVLPNIYVDENFKSLQHSFKVFRLLLLYHDPQVCMVLDQNDIVPELYATPWFVTCFSRDLPLEALYILWDHYLLQLVTDQFPYQHYFVCVAILILKRDTILACDRSELPSVTASLLNNRTRTSQNEAAKKHDCAVNRNNTVEIDFVKDVVKLAQKLRKSSPQTFLKIIYEVSFAPDIGAKNDSNKHLNALQFVYKIAEADLINGSLPSNHTVMIDTSMNILQMALEQVLILPIQPIEIVQFLHKNSSTSNNDVNSKKVNLDLLYSIAEINLLLTKATLHKALIYVQGY